MPERTASLILSVCFRNPFPLCRPRLLVATVCFALSVSALLAGPLQRVPNTSLQLPASPPAFTYTVTNAFPGLFFTNPVCMATPPGETNRLFVLNKNGVITVITNLAAPNQTVFMDITSRVISTLSNSGSDGEQGLLGLAFHPGYATNRYFFVFYLGNTTTSAGTGRHDILSRFQTSVSNPNQGDDTSEVQLIAQYDTQPNHNGGDIHFGPEGYLYVPLGDEGGGNDSEANSQRIDKDYFSAMLRIDVDKLPGNLVPNPHPSVIAPTNYAIPSDNPFIGATNFNGSTVSSNQVRTEFWAVGLRNPWRTSFDPVSGALYCADVGQATREEVNVITKGANYGWVYYEGFLQQSPPPSSGFTNTFPIIDYLHTAGRVCVIGGVVSRGNNVPGLYGAYLYAEYATGEIWALRHTGTNVTENSLIITDGGARMTTFGVDPSNGDVLYAANGTTAYATSATIKRIVNASTNGPTYPATLADTGAFTNLTTLEPYPGIVPYDINVHFWSDNAIKSRWFSVPDTNQVIRFNPTSNWLFTNGTVWVKHFELELTNGVAASRKRLETRFIVKHTGGVYGLTYRWGDSLTNATLVAQAGQDEEFTIYDGGGGILRTQVWHYPSRTECLSCHTPEGGFGLGFNTPQMNRDFDYSGSITNQLLALSQAGYFNTNLTSTSGLLALAHATNTAASLEFRTRSYLAANCVQCHQPNGSAFESKWDARITTPTALQGIVNGPLVNNFGNTTNHVVTPLLLSNSVMLTRISTRGAGTIQMPPLASNLVDTQNVALVSQWIMSLSNSFWIGASPDPLTIPPGAANVYTVTVLPTDDFVSSIGLSVSGLPAGASGAFVPPSVTGSNTSVLTITTLGSTPVGTYNLTLTGIGGGATNTDDVTLIIGAPSVPGTLLWTGASGAGTNWSTTGNWTNATAGGNSVPGALNDVVFTNFAALSVFGANNNVVDTTTTINSLWYGISPAGLPNTNHTTVINPGITLSVTGTNTLAAINGVVVNRGLLVGYNASTGNTGNNPMTGVTIKGGGLLNVNNPTADIFIAEFSTQSNHPATAATRAVLDMSGLDTFTASVARLLVGCWANGSAGTLYLARTNIITVGGGSAAPGGTSFTGIDLGNNNSNAGEPSQLFLGQTNAIFVNTLRAGAAKGYWGRLSFNPAFTNNNPRAHFRGTNGNAGRVATWIVSDLSAATGTANVTQPAGTNDFTGGNVDALIDTLILGKTTATSVGGTTATNRNSIGVLTFNSGTIDANNVTNGLQLANGNGTSAPVGTSTDSGIGIINVNGGTLRVNNTLTLAQGVSANSLPAFPSGTTLATAQGTLNIRNGGSVQANRIAAGTFGPSTITLASGTLTVTNTAGLPGTAISALNLTNSTLRLRITGTLTTNVVVTNLIASGSNTIDIHSISNVTTTTTFPLIAYSTFNGTVPANLSLNPLPAGLSGILTNNTARKTIDLIVTHGPAAPRISAMGISGTNFVFSGTNGAPNWNFGVLHSTNVALPLSNWTPMSTGLFDTLGNFRFTNGVDTNTPRRFYILQVP